jgi:hypothetical protein
MEEYVNSVEGLIEGRNIFFTRTFNQFRPVERVSAYSQFMLNERMYLEVMFRILNQEIRLSQATSQVVLNIPSSFLDSVAVTASTQQIASALQSLEGPHGNCAICQESIASTGSRIRQCGHTYHGDCINNWFTMSVRCPVCRHDIREQAGPSGQTSSGAE